MGTESDDGTDAAISLPHHQRRRDPIVIQTSSVAMRNAARRDGRDHQRDWEQSCLKRGLLDARLYMVPRSMGTPMMISSIIPINSHRYHSDRRKSFSSFEVANEDEDKSIKRAGVSYSNLLTTTSSSEHYDPFFLDDPNIRSGKHRVVMNLPGFIGTIISYVTAKDRKDELNHQFRAKHDWLPPSLTLTKIRSVKRHMLNIGRDMNLELSTVALAYVYFEKLTVKKVINKVNRKLAAAVSLCLAFKFNEGVGPQYQHRLGVLFAQMERELLIKRGEVLRSEFGMFTLLDFVLDVPPDQLLPHFNELLAQLPDDPLSNDTTTTTVLPAPVTAVPLALSSSMIQEKKMDGHHGHSASAVSMDDDMVMAMTMGTGQSINQNEQSSTMMSSSVTTAPIASTSSTPSTMTMTMGTATATAAPLLLSSLNDTWLPSVYKKPSFTKSGYGDVQWSLDTSVLSSSSLASAAAASRNDVTSTDTHAVPVI